VIDVYDAGTLGDGRPYLVMELCPGGSLNDALRGHGPVSPARVRDIGIRISDALAAAHAAGVLHRDIKPANILVNRYGVVGLSDFGLASIMATTGEQSVTREALTPAYASPESFRAEEPTAAGDIYSHRRANLRPVHRPGRRLRPRGVLQVGPAQVAGGHRSEDSEARVGDRGDATGPGRF
jgi:serine/threonine protein kinase